MWTPEAALMMDSGTRDQWLQSTGDRPQTLYQIFQISMEITRITRVQSSHTSPAPHTESFIGSKSGEETEHISSWEYLFYPGHCETLSPLKRETGHRFLTDTEPWEGKCRVLRSPKCADNVPWNIAEDTLHRERLRSELFCKDSWAVSNRDTGHCKSQSETMAMIWWSQDNTHLCQVLYAVVRGSKAGRKLKTFKTKPDNIQVKESFQGL